METCACGNPADGQGELCAHCNALRVLGLHPDATQNQIKAAYRVLVKVWHPDRFPGDPALRETADIKLKEINSAYAYLVSASPGGRRGTRRAHAQPTPQGASAQTESKAGQASAGWKGADLSTRRSSFGWIFPALGILFRFGLAAVVLLLGRYLWIAFNVQQSAEDAAQVYDYGKENVQSVLEAPKRRFVQAVEDDLRRLHLLKNTPLAAQPQSERAASQTGTQAGEKERASNGMRQPADARNEAQTISPYLTVGSTKEEVLAMLGTPTAASADKLVYGKSELDMSGDKVIGWRIDPVTSPIRVKLWPQGPVDTSQTFFTVGDSKDVVLVVQGTPTAFTADTFEYGGSVVYFQDGEVVRWKNDPTTIPLRARNQ